MKPIFTPESVRESTMIIVALAGPALVCAVVLLVGYLCGCFT